MTEYLTNGNVIIKCFRCRKEIDPEHQVYYVFIGKTRSEENEPFCTDCYLQDIKEMKELDPNLSHLYAKNFIRMNK